MSNGLAIGIDVGGTTVKGGVVDLATGALVGPAERLATPDPARIDDCVPVIAAIAARLRARTGATRLPIGIALSGDVRDGQHTTGVNLDDSWVGAPARELLEAAIGRPVRILNDADAAGLGEAAYGAARGVAGVVVVLTFGTGIGSAILHDGQVLPNSGFGQLPLHGRPVELLLSAVSRERRGVSWARWATDVSAYLAIVDELLRPDLIVLGGGVLGARDRFWPLLRPTCALVPAGLGPDAGIVGAARFAVDDR